MSSVSLWLGYWVSLSGPEAEVGCRGESVSRHRRHVEMEAKLAAAALGVGRLPKAAFPPL